MARRKKEPKSVHREKIASAASVLFLERGIAATSLPPKWLQIKIVGKYVYKSPYK